MKKKYLGILCLACLTAAFYTSCNNGNKKPEKPSEIAADTSKNLKKDSLSVEKSVPVINPAYNDLAKYIAGMEISSSSSVIDSSLLNKKEWKDYSQSLEKNWKKTDSVKIKKMTEWRNRELKDATSKTVFYPFSGADFLNVYTLFPSADNYIMVGLEPVGTLPSFHKGMAKDSLSSYFSKVKSSLYTILNFSFFRTKGMSADFKNAELNGTVHLILLFMERTGNSIVDIKPVAVSDEGKIISYKSFEDRQKDKKGNKGFEIDFVNSGNQLKKAYYFSVNLDNDHLNKNTAFVNLVNQNKEVTTYLKSASYLMYKDYFSAIRGLILDNSKFLLEDDSGIPYKYFNDSVWTTNLYGKYSGAISLFHNVYQAELEKAYKNKANDVKPLDFGIGYKYRVGESNLMFFKKK